MSLRRLVVLLLLLAACAPRQGSLGSAGSDAAAVRAFYLRGIEAFNARDLDAFMEQFAEDIHMYTPEGWLRERDAVRERFAVTFQRFPEVRMEIEDLTSRSVAPGVVVVDFVWRVFPMGAGPAFRGVGSGVYVRRGGRWVEVLEHETVLEIDEALRPPPR